MTIVNVRDYLREYIYLSNVFKYIESFPIMGHQIGRKVGDMLELITMGKVYEKPDLKSRLQIEPKLIGQTTAGHKVEFAFSDNDILFGFIECKKVGVERTKSKYSKKSLFNLEINEDFNIKYNKPWMEHNININIKVSSLINNETAAITVFYDQNNEENFNIKIGERFRIAITEDSVLHVVNPQDNLMSIRGLIRTCQIFNLEKIGDGNTKWAIWDCLPGPQTPEKAKQASFVSLDVRRKVNGHWGNEFLPEENRTLKSILVIGEFSHWEPKSRNMVITCIDYNLVVPDEIIINAFKRFNEEFGDGFWEYVTKTEYRVNQLVRDIINEIIQEYEGKVFFDISSNNFVDFGYQEGRLYVYDLE